MSLTWSEDWKHKFCSKQDFINQIVVFGKLSSKSSSGIIPSGDCYWSINLYDEKGGEVDFVSFEARLGSFSNLNKVSVIVASTTKHPHNLNKALCVWLVLTKREVIVYELHHLCERNKGDKVCKWGYSANRASHSLITKGKHDKDPECVRDVSVPPGYIEFNVVI